MYCNSNYYENVSSYIFDTIHSKCMNDNEMTLSECAYCLFKCKIYSRKPSKKKPSKLFLRGDQKHRGQSCKNITTLGFRVMQTNYLLFFLYRHTVFSLTQLIILTCSKYSKKISKDLSLYPRPMYSPSSCTFTLSYACAVQFIGTFAQWKSML